MKTQPTIEATLGGAGRSARVISSRIEEETRRAVMAEMLLAHELAARWLRYARDAE